MNKRLMLAGALALSCLLLSTSAMAGQIGTSKKIGIGLGGGTMTSGFTAKLYLSQKTAIQGVVGVSSWGTSVGVDFIKEFKPLWKPRFGQLIWGVGAGAGALLYNVGKDSATIIGVSGVIQLGWHFESVPIELITDWRPTFYIGDYIGGLSFNGGGGAIRWYF